MAHVATCRDIRRLSFCTVSTAGFLRFASRRSRGLGAASAVHRFFCFLPLAGKGGGERSKRKVPAFCPPTERCDNATCDLGACMSHVVADLYRFHFRNVTFSFSVVGGTLTTPKQDRLDRTVPFALAVPFSFPCLWVRWSFFLRTRLPRSSPSTNAFACTPNCGLFHPPFCRRPSGHFRFRVHLSGPPPKIAFAPRCSSLLVQLSYRLPHTTARFARLPKSCPGTHAKRATTLPTLRVRNVWYHTHLVLPSNGICPVPRHPPSRSVSRPTFPTSTAHAIDSFVSTCPHVTHENRLYRCRYRTGPLFHYRRRSELFLTEPFPFDSVRSLLFVCTHMTFAISVPFIRTTSTRSLFRYYALPTCFLRHLTRMAVGMRGCASVRVAVRCVLCVLSPFNQRPGFDRRNLVGTASNRKHPFV